MSKKWLPSYDDCSAICVRGLILLAILVLSACDTIRNLNPVSPTSSQNSSILPAWRPCVIVQNPGGRDGSDFKLQMKAVRELHAAGRMDWTRLGGANLQGHGRDYATDAKAEGTQVFAIITLYDLESRSSWNDTFDEMYAMYPEVDIWEIAGEITNPDPHVNPFITTPEIYMEKFKRLYAYVKSRYPRAALTNAPPYGSGDTGPLELERFFELGLLDMDVIVALNVYSDHTLSRYAVVLDKYAERLANKRIWVTETGSANPETQISWVENFYPRIIDVIHPEMICWYVLWGGDEPHGDNGFGLISGVSSGQVVERSLFKLLVGGNQ